MTYTTRTRIALVPLCHTCTSVVRLCAPRPPTRVMVKPLWPLSLLATGGPDGISPAPCCQTYSWPGRTVSPDPAAPARRAACPAMGGVCAEPRARGRGL